MVRDGQQLVFTSIAFPFANWLCLAFMAMILAILAMTPGLSASVWLVPAWLVVMWLGYLAKRRSAAVPGGTARTAGRRA
jgi:aromatic amino acid transport protein AroP